MFRTREQCERFQIMNFGISCDTCECSDQECPWGRRDELDNNHTSTPQPLCGDFQPPAASPMANAA